MKKYQQKTEEHKSLTEQIHIFINKFWTDIIIFNKVEKHNTYKDLHKTVADI